MKTKASEHKGLNNVSSVITSVNDMSSSKSAWYANRYARYRDNYEKAFFAHSNNAFFREAGKAVKCFLYAFIYYSFDKDYLVDEIIKGKFCRNDIVTLRCERVQNNQKHRSHDENQRPNDIRVCHSAKLFHILSFSIM